MEGEEDALQSAGPQLVPTNRCIEWIKAKIDVPEYSPALWREEYNELVNHFLEEEETASRLFFWVEEEMGLRVSNDRPPEFSVGEDKEFYYFIKPETVQEPISGENIESVLLFGRVDERPLDNILDYMNLMFVPAIKSEQKWPESVKKEFMGQLHRFMAILTEESHTRKGTTVLYIPNEDLSDLELAVRDKDLVQRLESTLIHWTRQIRKVVTNQDSQQENESAGPLKEIAHWQKRTVNLSRIKDQLAKPELQRVIKVLEQASSSYLKVFSELASQIERGTAEANDNLTHLQTLLEPCKKLETAKPNEIPELLKPILEKIKTIWETSAFYNTPDRITGLLRKISNEIIDRCIAIIDINDMLGDEVLKCMANLTESRSCGKTWESIFDETAKAIAESGGKQWNFNKGSIFSEIEAFGTRCSDLLVVCEGQLQFARKGAETKELPHFGGKRGPIIKKDIEEIEDSFVKYIDRMLHLPYNKLDVKKTQWNKDYNKFKLKLKDFESHFISIIKSAFEGVNTVLQGVEMLEAFETLAKREAIKQAVQKMASEVYKMFIADLDLVKKEYDARTKVELPTYQPRFGGAALWFRALITRIERQKQALEQLTFITDEDAIRDRQAANQKYADTHDYLKTYISKVLYTDWNNSIRDMISEEPLTARMEKPVFAKRSAERQTAENLSSQASHPALVGLGQMLRQGEGDTIESNFDHGLMKLISEVKCWEKLQSFGILIPSEIHDIAANREDFRIIKENVLLVVQDHNTIMECLNDFEKSLFTYHIQNLKKKLEAGHKSVKWNSKSVVDTSIREWRRQCSECYEKVKRYKKGTKQLEGKFGEIAAMPLLKLDIKTIYKKGEFEEQQRLHLSEIKPKMEKICLQMKEILNEIFSIFEIKSEMMKNDWARESNDKVFLVWMKYIEQQDKYLEDSIKKAVRSGLSELSKALYAEKADDKKDKVGTKVIMEKSKSTQLQIFELFVVLDEVNAHVDFDPTREALKQNIQGVMTDIVRVAQVIPRLEDVFRAEKKAKDQQSEAQGPASLSGVLLPIGRKAMEEEEKKEKESFYQAVNHDHDIKKHIKKTLQSIENCSTNLSEKLKEWTREHYTIIWKTQQKPYIKRLREQKPDIPTFEEPIETYTKLNTEIMMQNPTVAVNFVQINSNRIKVTLSKMCNNWIAAITELLNELARTELYDLYKIFDDSEKELSFDFGNDVEGFQKVKSKLRQLQTEVPKIEERIKQVEKKYDKLRNGEGGGAIPEEEEIKEAELPEKFNEWKEMLAVVDKRLDVKIKEFEKEYKRRWEDYTKSVQEAKSAFDHSAPFSAEEFDTKKAKRRIMELRKEQNDFKAREEEMQPGIKEFNLHCFTPSQISEMDRDLDLLDEIWGLKDRWDEQWNVWKTLRFADLEVDQMKDKTNAYMTKLDTLRPNIKHWPICLSMSNVLNTFMNTLPLIKNLKSKSIQERHWEELRAEVMPNLDHNSTAFTLEAIIGQNLHNHADFISDLANRAQQEMNIQEAINEIIKTWEVLELDVGVHKTNYLKLRSTDDIFKALEDNIVGLSSMKSQFFAAPFLHEIAIWEKTLSQINETVELLLEVQKKWVYLESIFVGQDDIKKQLSNETSHFNRVNEKFMEQMKRLKEQKNAKRALTHLNFYEDLGDLNKALDQIQKSLNQYLENKRQRFPRFYFISNDDLLAIIGQSKNPNEVKSHIKKLFEGIKQIDITDKPGEGRGKRNLEITAMISSDAEIIPLTRTTQAEGDVEYWLSGLEDNMRITLKSKLAECYSKLKTTKDKSTWVTNHPGQMLITAGQIKWTEDTARNLDNTKPDQPKGGPVGEQKKAHLKYIKKLVEMIRGKISILDRNKLVALITIEQHAKDVLEHLVEKAVNSSNDFEWIQQLRFESLPNQDKDSLLCSVKQTNTAFDYGYEYQGNNGRLVVTPLTDRCYMTLTTALHLRRGGAPQGPAGTGKTETVKDLGKNIAKYVVVMNCSEQLDFVSLGQLFKGIAMSGSWGCFDEFNRIEVEVLSVVAQQISTIQTAIREGKEIFTFDVNEIKLERSCGIFVTMNPGYEGRSELPDNLKSLFRPISMMAADLQLIAEIMLLSEGFEKGKQLSKKTVTLYNLMTQQLSKQDHYDFGMRALKSVLNCAGNMKREQPEMDEQVILKKALNDMNLPKFVPEDVDLFIGLISVIFVDVNIPEDANLLLKTAIVQELQEKGLQPTDMMVLKCIQLCDTNITRHGNMLVGGALSGKSTIWKTLKSVLTKLSKAGEGNYRGVKVEVLNPKAITMKELYGSFDSSNEWHDGVLSSVMRTMCADEGPESKWIILDGPVDTKWIENMNTVLDDNKMLTLINGDRISMPSTVRLLFEVENLAVASPATVSRAGMVYVDVDSHGYMPFLNSWILAKKEKNADLFQLLTELFEKYGRKLLEMKRFKCKELVPTSEINCVISMTRIFDTFMNDGLLDHGDERWFLLVEKWFLFALMWSVGATVDEDSRNLIDTFIRDIETGFPHKGIIFDYSLNMEKLEWQHWEDRLPPKYNIIAGTPFHKILIPTVDTIRNLYLIQGLVKANQHVLCVGSTGTGKTALIAGMLATLGDEFTQYTLNFSAQSSSGKVQEIIENSLDKRTSNKRGPPANKRFVLFIDDLNMPRKDEYGSQPPLELLRQWTDYGYWYDRSKLLPLYVLDMQFISAMGPPGGGRALISQRVQCHFNVINFTSPDDNQMKRIYNTIVNHHLTTFVEEVKPYGDSIAAATISLYRKVMEDFLPTPTKSHYLFNLRDVSKVVQGLYKADKNFYDSKESLVKLWAHESMRIFHDRLATFEDRVKFKELLNDQLTSQLGMNYAQCCLKVTEGETEILLDPVFVAFPKENDDGRLVVYEEIIDRNELKSSLEGRLKEYNRMPKHLKMRLVLFQEAVAYVCRIHRIITQARGNALLVGVGGSGRHSLTRLASFVAGYEVIQLEINKNYSMSQFREDIKKMNQKAGIERAPVVFLFSDNDVTNESFLEDVNNILSSGEVPNIYSKDEFNTLLETVKQTMKDKGIKDDKMGDNPEAIANIFQTQLKENLHICFCISPIGDQFRNYCRMYPGLVNNTTINWFMPWPEDALLEVAKKFLKKRADLDSIKVAISNVFCAMHVSVSEKTKEMLMEFKRHYYVTPTNYLSLVQGYIALLDSKQKEIGDNARKLRNGLDKLEHARIQVEKMSVELEAKKTEASKKQKYCEELVVQINQERAKADSSQREVERKSEEIEKEKKEVEIVATEAQADLDKAMPILKEAEDALEKLGKQEVAEVKAYSSPPEPVMVVMEAVMIVLGVSPPNWANAKKELSDPNFIGRIKNYDKENISNKILRAMEKYTKRPDFRPNVIYEVSRAASALCQWVHAMEFYAKTFRDVQPKRENVAALQSNLNKMEEKLKELTDKFQELTSLLQELDKQLKEGEREMELYKSEATELQLKLERAEKLVTGLASEKTRWESSAHTLEETVSKLPGDALISAAFLSYNGPFSSEYRETLVDKLWLPKIVKGGIPINKDFTFITFMAKQTEVREWNLKKLPTDKFSIENGILSLRGRRWPLMIDPQGQANAWVKNMETTKLRVIDPKGNYMKAFEECILFGHPLLFQDVEEDLDPSLDPVLNKSLQKRGSTFTIRLADKEIAYSNNFRLFMTTRLPNPHYTPEVSTKVTLVNFQVKQSGLEDQLLGILVRQEDARLEDDKDSFVIQIAQNNKELAEAEDKILSLLSAASASTLLDDEELINTLQMSKEAAEEVKRQIEEAENTMRKIDTMRENYRPSATKASVLFFVLSSLTQIDPMYQFSLESYIDLFKDSIEKSKEKNATWDSIQQRMEGLDEYHQQSVYVTTCRALFERHKLLLSLQMAVEMMKLKGSIQIDEYDFFLRGGLILGDVEMLPNPDPDWITQEMWDDISDLDRKLAKFHGIADSLQRNKNDWKRWFKTSEPENQPLPGQWDVITEDLLKKMIILRCLRPDRVIFSAIEFIKKELGKPLYAEPPAFNLEKLYESTKARQPILFVLHPGVDPSPMLRTLSKEKGVKEIAIIPLGKGQEKKASKAIESGVGDGNWVFLANCHLAISWMADLETLIEKYLLQNAPNEGFRLWLSSDPHPKFPISILQYAVKVTTEPPKGLKANMTRLYTSSVQEKFFTRVTEEAKYKKLLYSLCWFHSVLIERRKFKSLGWNEVYSFNDSDFEVSENILEMYLGFAEEGSGSLNIDPKNPPWDAIRYLIAEVSYGGRVTDDRDRRLLSVYALDFFNSNVVTEVKYKLSEGAQPYVIPDDSTYKAPQDIANYRTHFYKEHIKTFPSDKPEAFGQHVNAEISSQRSDTKDLLSALLLLQPQRVKAGEVSREDTVYNLCSELLEKIPQRMPLREIKDRWRNDLSKLKIVLFQEIARYNRLLDYSRNSLEQLQKGIKGFVVISSELEAVMNSLFENRVPKVWGFAYLSAKPLAAWIRDLEMRIKQLHDWAYGATPSVFWISGFTYPTGFTTALLQQTASRSEASIDTLSWDFLVQKYDAQLVPVKDGAYIRGLFLEGAKWNDEEGCLIEPEPMELTWLMPVIHFKPVKEKKKAKNNMYSCPCYVYPIRSGTREKPSFMLSVDLKSGERTPQFWIKRGTALLMSLET